MAATSPSVYANTERTRTKQRRRDHQVSENAESATPAARWEEEIQASGGHRRRLAQHLLDPESEEARAGGKSTGREVSASTCTAVWIVLNRRLFAVSRLN